MLEWASDAGVLAGTRVVRLGLPDTFVEHGSPMQLHDEVGLGPSGIEEAVLTLVGATTPATAAAA